MYLNYKLLMWHRRMSLLTFIFFCQAVFPKFSSKSCQCKQKLPKQQKQKYYCLYFKLQAIAEMDSQDVKSLRNTDIYRSRYKYPSIRQ